MHHKLSQRLNECNDVTALHRFMSFAGLSEGRSFSIAFGNERWGEFTQPKSRVIVFASTNFQIIKDLIAVVMLDSSSPSIKLWSRLLRDVSL